MLEKIREKLLAFVASDKDAPLLAGFSVGIYMLLYYYSKSFAHANSWYQLFSFAVYYIAMPMLVFFVFYKLFSWQRLVPYRKHMLFIGMIIVFSLFFLQVTSIGFSKKIVFAGIAILAAVLSFKLSKYYKVLILLLLTMALFNTGTVINAGYVGLVNNDEWRKLPDDIENVKFVVKPNVYYIQPDGYTSFDNFKNNKLYSYDNTSYIRFLNDKGFTMYNDYRSNYYSTLLSNSATFSMKHHYMQDDVSLYAAGGIIMDNPVLDIFKKNGYRTSFITESPYLLSNRPYMAYDYCNISYSELPLFGDGMGEARDAFGDLKKQMQLNSKLGNFYFVEKFSPGHIASFKVYSTGKRDQSGQHNKKLQEATLWLQKTVEHITANDPGAIIIIGADHGGFSGFDYALQAETKTTDRDLIYSIFGAQLAIKWNDEASAQYDSRLKTGVNLFRTLFAYLGRDKKYLDKMEENSSYIPLKNPDGKYRYLDENGNVVFRKI